MASLGLMSPGAATDGVTLFFLGKTGDLFNYRPLESDVSLPLPPFNVVYPVLFLNSATKNNFIRVSPLDGVSRGGPPPSAATGSVMRCEIYFNSLNHADVAHKCDRRTDRQTYRTAFSNTRANTVITLHKDAFLKTLSVIMIT